MTYQQILATYKPTIGIECHVQLKTKTKLFSGADNDARDKEPNTTVSPICFGFPGVLPVLNEEALQLAIKAGLALQADIPAVSRFERKHYFYPDLPKGYQITQLAEPVIVGGVVEAPMSGDETIRVRIHHAHLEEDAGKLTHPAGSSASFVDLNRAGTPLIEIVSEADMHHPAEARAYAQELYKLMTYAGVTYGDLYHGNMRFDVNLSLAPIGQETLGTRTEIKNLNSFRAVEKAAEFEAIRQAELLDAGVAIVQETRGWNEDKQKTFSQRSKADAHDYRYFPDADIPPVRITEQQVESIQKVMPAMPAAYRKRWAPLGLDDSVISALLSSSSTASLVASVQDSAGDEATKRVANWFSSSLGDADAGQPLMISQDELVELSNMVEQGELNSTAAKQIFSELAYTGGSPRELATARNLIQSNDEDEIVAVVEAVMSEDASQKAIEDIKSGNDKAIGYLVGQVMKQSAGKANPSMASTLIRARIQ